MLLRNHLRMMVPVDLHDQIILEHSANHVAVQHEADPTKHLLFCDLFGASKDFPNPIRESFVKGHSES